MRKTEQWIGLLALVFLISFGLTHFILPDRGLSEKENRILQQKPPITTEGLATGTWGTKYEAYLADQFPLRDHWLGLKAASEAYVLRRKELRGIYLAQNGRLIPKTEPPGDILSRNLSALSRIRERFDLPKAVIVPPTAATVLNDLLPANAPVYDETHVIDAVRQAVGEETLLDITKELVAVGEPAYFRTDHHWTMRGAYEAYAAILKHFDLEPLALETFERVTVSENFTGTSYAKACLWNLPPEPIAVLMPPNGYAPDTLFAPEKLKTYDQYAYFLGGNQPLTVVEGTGGTGRILAMVKDSYAHILAPLLSLHFDRLVLLDPRYVNADPYALLGQYEPTHLLVLLNTASIGIENGLGLFLRY